MFTLADLVLATFADLAGSIIGALLTPKRAAEYLHLAFGSKFPRLWSGTIVFTLALPFIVGAEDVLGGGSWFPWILVNMAKVLRSGKNSSEKSRRHARKLST